MVSKEASSEVPLRLKREHESKEMFSTPQTDGQDPVARRSPAPNDSISPHVHGQPLSNKHPDHSASMTQNDRYEEPESLLRTHATYPGSPCVCICSCAEEDMIVELEDDVRKPPCLVCQPTPPHSPPQQSGKLPHPALSIPRSTIPPSKSASEPHTPACSVRPREPQPRVGKDDSALGLIKPEKGQAQHPWTGSEKLQRQTVSSEPEKLPQAHSKTHAEEIEEAQHHFRDELLEADTTVMDVL
ncbi:hypothetical protein BCV70DRAFT_218247 [Testicularia cyperi]|uniref:Uncharacterized protein n=1 Tax=Testicularia cyperi TaxID=1882483 RepID=A0A317XKY5_9BASI|nr:hypothetical protein BCV70DRAFT_218247 [Testicularia cyperi]